MPNTSCSETKEGENEMSDEQSTALSLPKSAEEVDSLIVMADRAERAIEAVKKIKRIALAVTNKQDWVDEGGKPYLQSSGAEKIGPLFGISWLIDPEPTREVDADGHYSYNYRGTFTHSVNGKERSITAIGSRTSKDDFFRVRYRNNQRVELPANEVDKESVKQAAHTNCLVNGITRILGIRNLTWEEVEEYTGFKRENTGKVAFKQNADPNEAMKLPNYGHNHCKGRLMNDDAVTVDDLRYYLKGAEKNLAEGKYVDYNERLKAALLAEIEKREKAVPTAAHAEGSPPAAGDGHLTIEELSFRMQHVESVPEWSALMNQFEALADVSAENRKSFKDLAELRKKELTGKKK
jgi:hypothetical protein